MFWQYKKEYAKGQRTAFKILQSLLGKVAQGCVSGFDSHGSSGYGACLVLFSHFLINVGFKLIIFAAPRVGSQLTSHDLLSICRSTKLRKAILLVSVNACAIGYRL